MEWVRMNDAPCGVPLLVKAALKIGGQKFWVGEKRKEYAGDTYMWDVLKIYNASNDGEQNREYGQDAWDKLLAVEIKE